MFAASLPMPTCGFLFNCRLLWLHVQTPTLGKHPQHEIVCKAEPKAAATAGISSGSRHRLANISNLPASPRAASAAPDSYAFGTADDQLQDFGCLQSPGTMQRQQLHLQLQPGKQQRRRQGPQVHFAGGLFSPPATLPGPGAAFTATPHPLSLAGASGRPCPGSAGQDDGFVLFMSQTYSRASQPAISPSVAAGLSVPEADAEAAKEAGVSTTPSQDSREPCMQSPSNVTFSNAAGAVCQQEAQADTHIPLVPIADPAAGPSRYGSNSSTTTAFDRLGSAGGSTPGDALAAPLLEDLEETTTPELEQIGYSSQDFFSASQQSAGAAAGAGKPRGAAPAAILPSTSKSGVVCEEVTAKPMLFPIFRPKAQRKCVILIRHGESEYNSRDARSKSWSDPTCFDAPLTERGRGQARDAWGPLVELLKRHKDRGSTLWLSSPLARALETMLLAYPDVQHLAKGRHGTASAAHLAQQPASHRVVVLGSIAEQCATVGDVGRPTSELVKQFPALSEQLGQLPEKWWFDPCPDRPNCAVTRQLNRKERPDEVQRRVSEFSRWLTSQPEQLVVAFGHSVFWQRFAHMPKKMANCEVHQFWF
eukprot:GHUV01024961.1.p1 GENE.GHUV01024961.1~~GHUV01024961.1.p1  ORF type:complete len:592 (+),score=201.36 GHUV01024961.1:824-2599(+)